MALDKEYFDSIHIDVVKKKYYNANKVEAVMTDIRTKAEALEKENAELRSQVEAFSRQKAQIGDAILSSKAIAQQIIADAEKKAEEIVRKARDERSDIEKDTQKYQDELVQHIEGCYTRMKDSHLACIESLQREWQNFLCGLYPEEQSSAETEVPADLSEKVGAIAKELFEMDSEKE